MRILGIETSCDETAVAVIDVGGSRTKPRLRILSNVVASQVKLHAKFGGVVPHLAKREHQRNLVTVLLMALRRAGLSQSAKRKAPAAERFAIRDLRLAEILAREPDLFARMMERVVPLPKPRFDAIAVTVGPGLAPALWVGVNFARALAYLWEKPIIPVNHLEGHIYTNLLPQIRVKSKFQNPNFKQISNPKSKIPNALEFRVSSLEFPAIALLVSGGHTELVLMRGYGKYRIIGETLDDAAGEAFDKVARLLGLPYPGGPAISIEAEKNFQFPRPRPGSAEGGPISNFQKNSKFQIPNSKNEIELPRPMINSGDFNFSFSGLKTAVLYLLRDLKNKYPLARLRPLIAGEFQDAVVDVLVAKTVRAARQFRVKTVMIGGGVAANKKLRHELGQVLIRELPGTRYLTPDTRLTGDNALMIAIAGWFRRNKKSAWQGIQADANLRLDGR